jgi:hypothetical protein
MAFFVRTAFTDALPERAGTPAAHTAVHLLINGM